MHIPVSQNAFETARNFRGFANHKTRHAGFLVHMAHRHEAQYSSSSHNRKVLATVQSLLNDSRCVTPYRKALAGMRYSLELLPWRIPSTLAIESLALPRCTCDLQRSVSPSTVCHNILCCDAIPPVSYWWPYSLSIITPSHRAASDASVRLQC